MTASWRNADGTINEAAVDAALEAAGRTARAGALERDAQHAAFHKIDHLRYGRVGRRPGYRGDTVCLDCYHGREWR